MPKLASPQKLKPAPKADSKTTNKMLQYAFEGESDSSDDEAVKPAGTLLYYKYSSSSRLITTRAGSCVVTVCYIYYHMRLGIQPLNAAIYLQS